MASSRRLRPSGGRGIGGGRGAAKPCRGAQRAEGTVDTSLPSSPPPYNESSLIVNPIVSLKRRRVFPIRHAPRSARLCCSSGRRLRLWTRREQSAPHRLCRVSSRGNRVWEKRTVPTFARDSIASASSRCAPREPCTDRPQSAASESINRLIACIDCGGMRLHCPAGMRRGTSCRAADVRRAARDYRRKRWAVHPGRGRWQCTRRRRRGARAAKSGASRAGGAGEVGAVCVFSAVPAWMHHG